MVRQNIKDTIGDPRAISKTDEFEFKYRGLPLLANADITILIAAIALVWKIIEHEKDHDCVKEFEDKGQQGKLCSSYMKRDSCLTS